MEEDVIQSTPPNNNNVYKFVCNEDVKNAIYQTEPIGSLETQLPFARGPPFPHCIFSI
jgi:hypothetical protein